jgi:hypothetical protein
MNFENVMIRHIFLAIAVTVSTPGCQAHIFSPPARINLLESSATLKTGQQSVAIGGGGSGALFGFSATALAGTYKKGLTDQLEVGVDGTFVAVDDSHAVANLDPYIMGGRVKAKWAPDKTKGFAAVTAGIGAGYSIDGGGYVSPDLGLIAAFENRYFVPFVGASAFVSQPIASKVVDISHDDEDLGTRLESPQFTWGGYLNAGFKIPFAIGERQTLNIYAEFHTLYLDDGEEDEFANGFMAGPEIVF